MLTRRDFFGAAAGMLAASTQGTQAKGKERIKLDTGMVPDHFVLRGWYLTNLPELELGHSARWKIQRYPGAKWVAIHDDPFWWVPEGQAVPLKKWPFCDYAPIYPIITDCDMEAVG